MGRRDEGLNHLTPVVVPEGSPAMSLGLRIHRENRKHCKTVACISKRSSTTACHMKVEEVRSGSVSGLVCQGWCVKTGVSGLVCQDW